MAVLYALLFLVAATLLAPMTSGVSSSELGRHTSIFQLLLPGHVFTRLDLVALGVIYLVYVARTSRLPTETKVFWAAMLVFGSVIVMLLFWSWHIWKPLQIEAPPQGSGGES